MNRILHHYLYCGQDIKIGDKYRLQYLLHNSFLFVVFVALLYFCVSSSNGAASLTYLFIMMAMTVNYMILYLTAWIRLSVLIASLALIFSLAYLVYILPLEDMTFIWVMIIPFFIFVINGVKVGSILAVVNILIQTFALSSTLAKTADAYPENLYTAIIALTVLSLFMYLFERNRDQNMDALLQHKRESDQKLS